MYMAAPPTDPTLRAALGVIHRDRGWWYKVLIGGALYLTVLGGLAAEGFQLESIENSQRGYPTPLPRWADWNTKALIGIFGAMIDFFFFLFPMMLGGLLLICGSIGISSLARGWVVQAGIGVLVVIVVAYELLVWLSSAGIMSKLTYVREGDISAALRTSYVRSGFRRPVAGVLAAVRLRSLVVYAVALLILVGGFFLPVQGWLRLAGVWLGLSAVFYARLVAIQLYVAATALLEQQQFAAAKR